jgi:hypothetical protein
MATDIDMSVENTSRSGSTLHVFPRMSSGRLSPLTRRKENFGRVLRGGLTQEIILSNLDNVLCLEHFQACVSLSELGLLTRTRLEEHFEFNIKRILGERALKSRRITNNVRIVYETASAGMAALGHLQALEDGQADDFWYLRRRERGRPNLRTLFCKSNAFVDACLAGVNMEVLDRFLATKPKRDDSSMNSALLSAVKHAHLDTVRYFIQKEVADREMKVDFNAALILACDCGHLDVVKLLISTYAIGTVDSGGIYWRKVLIQSCISGHAEIVEYLLTVTEVVNVVNQVDHLNRTALMHATLHGHFEIVNILLKISTIDVYTFDIYGNTALMLIDRVEKKTVNQERIFDALLTLGN